MEPFLGGSMTSYWLAPDKVLWKPDYTGTNTLEILDESDPDYDSKLLFLNYRWIPTGQHGKFIPHKITNYVVIYPAQWKGEWTDWPRCRLHFVDGILESFKDITGERSL